ncbi:hypothetical protein LXA43DRAFT_999591, partial [Ganoderma leucocontextum]
LLPMLPRTEVALTTITEEDERPSTVVAGADEPLRLLTEDEGVARQGADSGTDVVPPPTEMTIVDVAGIDVPTTVLIVTPVDVAGIDVPTTVLVVTPVDVAGIDVPTTVVLVATTVVPGPPPQPTEPLTRTDDDAVTVPTMVMVVDEARTALEVVAVAHAHPAPIVSVTVTVLVTAGTEPPTGDESVVGLELGTTREEVMAGAVDEHAKDVALGVVSVTVEDEAVLMGMEMNDVDEAATDVVMNDVDEAATDVTGRKWTTKASEPRRTTRTKPVGAPKEEEAEEVAVAGGRTDEMIVGSSRAATSTGPAFTTARADQNSSAVSAIMRPITKRWARTLDGDEKGGEESIKRTHRDFGMYEWGGSGNEK